jgi:hypothetical protein
MRYAHTRYYVWPTPPSRSISYVIAVVLRARPQFAKEMSLPFPFLEVFTHSHMTRLRLLARQLI